MEVNLLRDDFKWDNLWESEEAREAVQDWLRHPGYAYFSRRCRIGEVQQLRIALEKGPHESGIFKGMVRTRRLPELMASESRIKEPQEDGKPGALVIPDDEPDYLHAALLQFLMEWEGGEG